MLSVRGSACLVQRHGALKAVNRTGNDLIARAWFSRYTEWRSLPHLQPYAVYRIIDVHDLTQENVNRLTKKDPVVNMENKWWDSDTLAVVTGGKPPSCLV
jgi:hypothetical protein